MKKILVILLWLISYNMQAQTVTITDYYSNNTKSDNVIKGLIKTNDGYIICGYFKDSLMLDTVLISNGNNDAYILKLDNNKIIQWVKHFGATKYDAANFIHFFNSNILTSFIFLDTLTIDSIFIPVNPSSSNSYNILSNINSNTGAVIWADTGYLLGLKQYSCTIDSNFLFGSKFIYKVDNNGNKAKIDSGVNKYTQYGGIAVSKNNIYAYGAYDNYNAALIDSCIIIGAGKVPNNRDNAFFVKKDKTTLKNIWARAIETVDTYIGPSFNFREILVDKNENVFVIGDYMDCKVIFHDSTILQDGGPNFSTFVAKYDSSGNLLWARRLCGGGLRDADIDSIGDLYISCGEHGAIAYAGTTSSATTNSLSVFKLSNNNVELYALPVPNYYFGVIATQLMVFAPDSFLLAGAIILDSVTVDTVTFINPGASSLNLKSFFVTLRVNSVPVPIITSCLEYNPLTIYPNPVSEVLNITSKAPLQQLSIVNIAGTTLQVYNGNVTQIPTTRLPIGIYLLKSVTSTGVVQYSKFIK